MTIAKYIRLSSADEDTRFGEKAESNSIVNQRHLLDSYIAARAEFDGCTILEFHDDGASGTNLNRPGIQALLARVRQGEIDCVIVKDLSRLGRNHLDTGDLIEQVFPFLGVRLIAVNDSFDSTQQSYGTAGNLDTGLRNLINELYSRDISQKIKLAKKQYATRGEATAAYLCYGYMKDPADKHKRIVDPVAAPVVRQIFSWYAENVSRAEIARRLNAQGVAPPMERKRQLGVRRRYWNTQREKTDWADHSIAKILRDEQYTGKLIYGKTERRVVGDQRSSRENDPSDWVVIPDAFEPVVSQELFDRVQTILDRAYRASPRAAKEKPLFYHKLKCGVCGLALARVRTKRPHYKCSGKAWNSGDACAQIDIFEDELIRTVLASIRLQAQLARKERRKRTEAQRQCRLPAATQDLQRKLDKLAAERKTLYLQFHEGSLDAAAFRQKSDAIKEKETSLRQRLMQAEPASNDLNGNNAVFCESGDLLSQYTNLRTLDRSVVEKLIQSIRVYEGGRIEIEWKFAAPFNTDNT